MTFNSLEFLVFFPIVVALYAIVARSESKRDVLLLLASYVFYMGWNWKYAGLILFSTTVDYFVGLRMAGEERSARRRSLLIVSLVLNLGLLGFFKYHNFFVDSVGALAAAAGFGGNLDSWKHGFLLPVGISFYTFQSLSYTIDLYRGRIDVERSFTKFALYVAFFPQLVAGPIVRASEFLPQLRSTRVPRADDMTAGMALIFRGLFKKVVLADLLAALGVDAVFRDPGAYSSVTLMLALYGYAFQIYNDFSGYSDIAIGTARCLGFRLPENFNRPYIAQNVREFWTRWHISLSTWLRDYLYIPLGGNRSGPVRTIRNLMITMLLGGLWHGAALNFVLWGGWHGLLLVAARRVPKQYADLRPWRVWLRMVACFHLITFSWLLFRISSWDALVAYVRGIASFTGGLETSWLFVAILGVAAAIHWTPKRAMDRAIDRLARAPIPVQAVVYGGLIVLFAGLSFGGPAFIYFQF